MWNGVRARLLISYVSLLLVTLLVTSAALLAILSAQPAPPEQTYRDILSYVSGISLQGLRPENLRNREAWLDNLMGFADGSDFRIIILDGSMRTVVEDSAGLLEPGEALRISENSVSRQRIERDARFSLPTEYTTGAFRDADGDEWLFVGLAGGLGQGGLPPLNSNESGNQDRPRVGERFPRLGDAERPLQGRILLFAAERPSTSFGATLNQFGADLWTVIVQAGAVGLVIASGMAVFVSRTIARPLQRLAVAANAVAEGDYGQQVGEDGPTEIQKVAHAFNHMSEQVQLNNQAQRDLLANVSHDLKTPLTSIQGFSQAIMDGTAPDPPKAAGVIYEEAGRLTRMVSLLTELARIKAGRLMMRQDALDISQMMEAMTQKIDIVAQKKDIQLHTKFAPSPTVKGDGDRLAQVMTNLLSNAVKYTPKGGHVLAAVEPSRNGVQITVRDTGIGIPQEDLSRVFERFYQVDKSRGPKRGHGLGLAITHEIVEAHGGKINVASDGAGKGTTFTVWLPAA
jgi:signal transduction histidine kinase